MAKEASEVCELLKPIRNLSTEQKVELEKAKETISIQKSRFRGLLMAADANHLDRLEMYMKITSSPLDPSVYLKKKTCFVSSR